MIDTRFSTALQIVISVAVNDEANLRTTSQSLAQGLDTSASFVRKLLLPLNEGGILATAQGGKGGIRLARPRDQILLSQIYAAVTGDKKIWATRHDIPHEGLVGENIGDLSEFLCDRAEQAVVDMLGSVTIEDSVAELRRLEAQKSAGHPQPVDAGLVRDRHAAE
ncbi:Rrf2 family transcriptional regulator [Rhizobium sp. 3T7]|uniref:RrF2 family transcriptional regulator n=1 Tax=Rhizobium sp. 3T7 TaxID=2874922 RepID=UPI001CC979EE|nr:Rrf2 family transcriptional regulator [Rhizobium sp. 3T7]MBZ9792264.1 Rrf2 family transcriptional regulator [Rhizobium sp. 3T7]